MGFVNEDHDQGKVEWHDWPGTGLLWSETEGLVVVLVRTPNMLDAAVALLRQRLDVLRADEPATGGELVLDPGEDWPSPATGHAGFDDLAKWYDLDAVGITLSVTDGETLEKTGSRVINGHSNALKWARETVGRRYQA
jgi:hypothetical protein